MRERAKEVGGKRDGKNAQCIRALQQAAAPRPELTCCGATAEKLIATALALAPTNCSKQRAVEFDGCSLYHARSSLSLGCRIRY
eukprot:6178579-Pleurochrysis_carterae.AAC.3